MTKSTINSQAYTTIIPYMFGMFTTSKEWENRFHFYIIPRVFGVLKWRHQIPLYHLVVFLHVVQMILSEYGHWIKFMIEIPKRFIVKMFTVMLVT